MNKRKKLYYDLNSKLSSLSDSEIKKLLSKNKISEGWGSNHILNKFGSKFFVKKIPLTKLESENMFCTKNLFRLPLYYNYGVGSAGFGAFRELNLHIKTTNWVLTGEIDNFPLMYHYRIVRKEKSRPKLNIKQHKKYIEYWNRSKTIDQYIKARNSAPYEIIVFLEFIPHTLNKWFSLNTEKVQYFSREMFKTITFLREKGIIHFDAHFGNILTDGKKPYLSDFGLGLDIEFCHTKKEKDFFREHINYDFCEYLGCVAGHLENSYQNLSDKNKAKLEEDYQITTKQNYFERNSILMNSLDTSTIKLLKLNTGYCRFIKKHHKTIRLMNDFFENMRANKKKNTKFESRKLRTFLKEAKVIK